MGLFTSVKETVLGTDDGVDGAEGVGDVAEKPASEADFVVATGRSREDALVELVEASGGRVRQSELVERTEWSKATVSRYLGALEDDGAIDRVSVGRQKVVLLPGESLLDESLGPDDADGSPNDAGEGPDGGPTSDASYPRT